ncbi:unnamed protein product [Polarella glacialis]|uniref:SET domain-containing protein n=1 Tax=Polarella glacialis TaxID=89957 RepID=A0A813IF10_POLGL|nr:unnamed protein product [Polarella glacialis]
MSATVLEPAAPAWSEFFSSLLEDDPSMDAEMYHQLIVGRGFVDVTKKAVQNRLKRVRDKQRKEHEEVSAQAAKQNLNEKKTKCSVTGPDFELLGDPLSDHGRSTELKLSSDVVLPTGSWEIRKADGKGCGVFANVDIAAGDVILVEEAIVVLSVPDAGNFVASVMKNQEFGDQAAAKMDGMDVAKVMELHDSFADHLTGGVADGVSCEQASKLCEKGKTFMGVFLTNAIPANSRAESAQLALCLNTARFNHSCAPNALYKCADTSESSDKHICVVRALRGIPAGQEICVSYMSVPDDVDFQGAFCMGPRAQRRESIRWLCGCPCMCAACAQDEQKGSASDDRRAEICLNFVTVHRGVEGLARSGGSGVAAAVEGACQEVFDLIKVEGLGVEGLRLIKQMAEDVFKSFQHETRPSPAFRSRAAVWARRLYEINRFMFGAFSDYTVELLRDAQSLAAQADHKSKRK